MPPTPPAPRLARRSVGRFISEPSSIRNATLVLINVTVLIVLAGSVIVWIFDSEEFPDFGTAIWYTLQTVTTVGYGDVTPTTTIGRSIGGVVMIVAVALLTIINALITSILIDASQRQRRAEQLEHDKAVEQQLLGQLQLLNERLERIEGRTAAFRERAGLDERASPADPSA
jgi:voltage-gated potassium channel